MNQALEILPRDTHNEALLQNVHPPTWVNPAPAARYHLVVVGGGTAGLIAASGAAGLGARVALVEREFLGGDCLNVGCVPSKAIIRAARALSEIRRARGYGAVVPDGARGDFPAIMERMRRLRASISPADSAKRYASLGVDVFFGEARFAGREIVEAGGARLKFRRAVIATGARAARPRVAGLAEAGFLTNENVFSLTELPRRLAVLGAGPIGCELAQAFASFGAEVTLIGKDDRILPREDREAAERVRAGMERDGVKLLLSSKVARVERRGTEKNNPEKIIRFAAEGAAAGIETELAVDEILVGAGRVPAVEGLGLEAAGVEWDAREGVRVDDRLRTTNPRIFAAGDVCTRFKFTHAADALARIVIQNALFFGRAKASALVIPRCTYTDPEIAHVGLGEEEARARGIALRTYTQDFRGVDRAVLDGDEEGLLKIHTRAGSDRIAGATLVARHAGEMISELTLAMVGGLGLRTISRTIHPYPTQAESIRRAADAHQRERLTPRVRGLFERWFRWTLR